MTDDRLDALATAVRRDLSLINVPPANWPPDPSDPEALDVLVVGAGQMGLAASFALTRAGIRRHLVIDAAPEGREGPWVTYARMNRLRSPNHLVGPAQDIPSLTFRSWYEAQHGAEGWARLGKIPRGMWQEYLGWFRRVLALPVVNEVRLVAVEPAGDALRVTLAGAIAGTRTVRRLVLASGRDGLGGPNLPDWVPTGDPRFLHSTAAIDFEALRGRAVAVVGASASAFDNAATALEAGATVHMLVRRPGLSTLNRFKAMVHAGFTHGFPSLPDAERLAFLNAAFEGGVAPPAESVERMQRHPGFFLHTGTAVRGVDTAGADVVLDLDAGDRIRVDTVILGTGFRVDITGRPELAALHGRVALWRDRDVPRAALGAFADHPYLAGDFGFTPHDPADAWVANVHAFNIGAMASLGLLSGDIPGVGDGARRLGEGIARSLFLEDAERHMAVIRGYTDKEIAGDELAAAQTRSAALRLRRAS